MIEFLEAVWLVFRPLLEISVMAFLLYRFQLSVLQTKAQQIAPVMIAFLSLYIVSYLLNLETLLFLYRHGTLAFILFIMIVYQPELRRTFTALFSGRPRFPGRGEQTTGGQIDIVLNACDVLISRNRGALIVFTRQLGWKGVSESGTRIQAELSSALILSIFEYDGPLHDGAVIINKGKIQAAGVYLPMSEQSNIKKSFGTRHRAALGLAEESDAVILVVSEETGKMSLAFNAQLMYDLDSATVKQMLLSLFSYHDEKKEEPAGGQSDEDE